MTVPFLCVIGVFALNYFSKIPVMIAMQREGKGYDNKNPREQQARLQGWGKRAVGAHQNGFEVSPLFASCVLIGHLTEGDPTLMGWLAVTFVVSRIVYIALYLLDLDKFRSLVWGLGILCSFGIALSGCGRL